MTKKDLNEEVALFRYGIIADLANLPPGAKGLYTLIKKKAAQNYVIPGVQGTAGVQGTVYTTTEKKIN